MTGNQRIDRLVLEVVVNRGAAAQAKGALDSIRVQQVLLADQFQKGTISLAVYNAEFDKLNEQAKEAKQRIRDVGNAEKQLQNVQNKVGDRRIRRRAAKLEGASQIPSGSGEIISEVLGEGDFNKAEKAAENLRGLGAQIRNFSSIPIGDTGFSTDEVGNALRTLSNIMKLNKEDALKYGLALGAAGVAIVGLIIAFGALADVIAEKSQEIQDVIDALNKKNLAVAQGKTSEEVIEENKDIEAQITARKNTTGTIDREIDNTINSIAEELGLAGNEVAIGILNELKKDSGAAGVLDLRDELLGAGLLTAGVTTSIADAISADTPFAPGAELVGYIAVLDDLNKKREAELAILDPLEAQLTVNNTALKNGEFAANDAAVAQEKLNEQMEEAALQSAEFAASLFNTSLEASRFGLDALNSARQQLAELQGARAIGAGESAATDRLQALRDEQGAIQAQIDSLETFTGESEKVTEELEGLRRQLDLLGQQAQIVERAIPAARARDSETAAILAQIDALKEAEKEREKAAQEAEREAKRIDDELKRAAERREDIERQYQDKLEDIARKTKEKLADFAFELQRDFTRAVQDLIREFNRDVSKGMRENDFLGLAELRIEYDQAREDLLIKTRREQEDKLRDLQLSNQRERQEALIARDRAFRDLQTGLERSIGVAAQWANTFPQLVAQGFNNAMNAVNRGGQQGSGSGSGSNQNTTRRFYYRTDELGRVYKVFQSVLDD